MTEPAPVDTPLPVRTPLSEADLVKALREVRTTIPEEPPSRRLRLVTWYFELAAGLSVLRMLFLGLLAIWGPSNVATVYRDLPFQFIIAPIITTIGLWWTARELRERSRQAWIPAMIALAAPLIMALLGRQLPPFLLAIAVAGIVTLISVRKELD